MNLKLLLLLFFLTQSALASKGFLLGGGVSFLKFRSDANSGVENSSPTIGTEFGLTGRHKFSRTVAMSFDMGIVNRGASIDVQASGNDLDGEGDYKASYLFARVFFELTNDDKFGFLLGYGVGKVQSASVSVGGNNIDFIEDDNYSVPGLSAFYFGIETQILKLGKWQFIPRLLTEIHQSDLVKQNDSGNEIPYGLVISLNFIIVKEGAMFE